MSASASMPSSHPSNVAAGSSGSLPPLPVRTVSESEYGAFYAQLLTAFHETEPEQTQQLYRSLMEPGRSLAAYEDGRAVATASTFSFAVTVPGGESVPAGGLSMVSVAQTHRRRGILRSLMRRQLDDVHERGEALAVLTASEGGIYGRFGYGVASRALRLSIPARRVSVAEVPGIDGYRLAEAETGAEETVAACEQVYAAAVPRRPGMLRRMRPGWERLGVDDPEEGREGWSALRTFVVRRDADGEVAGYARFRVKPNWEETGAEYTAQVKEVQAVEPAAYAALWRLLLSLDLVRDVEVRSVPLDDPLLWLLDDLRVVRQSVHDDLYLRPVDLGAALAARRYAEEVDVVLDVEDAFCPWNTGRWRLSGGPKGAECARTGDAADLALTVREAGSAYLGSVPLQGLADAGRVRELTRGAVAVVSRALRGEREAWLPHGF